MCFTTLLRAFPEQWAAWLVITSYTYHTHIGMDTHSRMTHYRGMFPLFLNVINCSHGNGSYSEGLLT